MQAELLLQVISDLRLILLLNRHLPPRIHQLLILLRYHLLQLLVLLDQRLDLLLLLVVHGEHVVSQDLQLRVVAEGGRRGVVYFLGVVGKVLALKRLYRHLDLLLRRRLVFIKIHISALLRDLLHPPVQVTVELVELLHVRY